MNDRYKTAFGQALAEQLARRHLRQADLARATSSTPGWVNKTMTGAKAASPGWADLIADVLGLGPEERRRLHYAAARDAGFKLDLTP